MSLRRRLDPCAGTSVIHGCQSPIGHSVAGQLIGRVDLNPVAPPKYAIGYWLDEASCGRGYATMACAAVIAHAGAELGATAVIAGVTHGNDKSVAVLTRLGFVEVAQFETYVRFHLPLDGGLPLRRASRVAGSTPATLR